MEDTDNLSEQQFADICGSIEEIAWKYFHDIDEEVSPHFPSGTCSY